LQNGAGLKVVSKRAGPSLQNNAAIDFACLISWQIDKMVRLTPKVDFTQSGEFI
jgi:hypothetical protein